MNEFSCEAQDLAVGYGKAGAMKLLRYAYIVVIFFLFSPDTYRGKIQQFAHPVFSLIHI